MSVLQRSLSAAQNISLNYQFGCANYQCARLWAGVTVHWDIHLSWPLFKGNDSGRTGSLEKYLKKDLAWIGRVCLTVLSFLGNSVCVNFHLITLIGFHFSEWVCVLSEKQKSSDRNGLCLGINACYLCQCVWISLCSSDFAQ